MARLSVPQPPASMGGFPPVGSSERVRVRPPVACPHPLSALETPALERRLSEFDRLRAEQGLPPTVTDPLALRAIARILRPVR